MTASDLRTIIQTWAAAARPIAAADPAAAAPATGYGGVDGLAAKLVEILDTKSLSFAEAFIVANLQQATANLNSVFGSNLTVPTVSEPLPMSIYEAAPLTPEQTAALGPGVIEPDLATEPAQIQPTTTYPTVVNAVTEPAPLPPPPPNISEPVAPKAAPTTTTNDMATDPYFDSATTTTAPAPVAASLGSDIINIASGALGAAAGGGNIGDVILGGLGGYTGGIGSTPDQTALPQPAGSDSNLLNQLLQLLGSIPGGQVPAAVISGAQSLIGNGTQTGSTAPATGSGLPAILEGGGQLVTAPEVGYRYKAPKGYVMVTLQGQRVAMYKPLAQKLGLWHSRPKPPITASEWRNLKRAERTKNKAKKIAQTADFHVYNEARAAKTCRTRK